uniref:Uncharacterized protein n=1 Tax=Physcomitrium patens TaxID=3218 RepID=A0A2K1I9L6_PHYPA|nr:hypothetical protein PHYPA_031265 [Physcomitrium patens]
MPLNYHYKSLGILLVTMKHSRFLSTSAQQTRKDTMAFRRSLHGRTGYLLLLLSFPPILRHYYPLQPRCPKPLKLSPQFQARNNSCGIEGMSASST